MIHLKYKNSGPDDNKHCDLVYWTKEGVLQGGFVWTPMHCFNLILKGTKIHN